MAQTLYVIGNGFDLHHGIESGYWRFGEYLKGNDAATFEVVERYFELDGDFWSDFEARLASFNIDTLIDDASDLLVSYGADEWSDSYHHDYQYEISQAVEAVSVKMRARFGDWIRQLAIPDPSTMAAKRIPMDLTAKFLNFNYTPSLQQLYGVDDANILHIHGAAKDPNAELILGHAWARPRTPEPDPEVADTRVMEGQRIIDDYFQTTFKPTQQVIAANAGFFTGLSGVERILVIGHSISEVDHPYFLELMRNVDISRVRWKISYHGDPTGVQRQVAAIGIPSAQVEFALLADF